MNFLQRYTSNISFKEPAPAHETPVETRKAPKVSGPLEGLVAEDPFPQSPMGEDRRAEVEELVDENGTSRVANASSDDLVPENHLDVSEKEGWITIPQGKLPDDWDAALDIHSLRSLDRSFVFPGEQIHILACLSACKQDTEIITPFKVAAVMSKNSGGQSPDKHSANMKDGITWDSVVGEVVSDGYQNGKDTLNQETDPLKDILASESFLRMEEHKRQTEILLQRFQNSHFFVRIAESGEPLWSKKGASDLKPFQIDGTVNRNALKKTASSCLGALIDKGSFDANVSGGVARDSINCCSLPNGDIVVLLQVNVGVNFLRDPVIEILQFEKYQNRNLSQEFQDNFDGINYDPCGELLKWLLPIDNTIPPSRAPSPPRVNTGPVGGTPQKPNPSSSQLFPHFRSYSMSSLPHNTVSTPQTGKSTPQTGKAQSSRPGFEIGEWNQYSSQMSWEGQKNGGEGLLSFRGVSLEQDRFSVHCGLEGIYIPGRRWRRKLEIIQPIEIRSFAADCNTDDLLCVQIKNVSPTHVAEIVVYIDAITIVFEEASKGGSPSSLPIACIEAGNDHSLPNLALRRGEEHSFIVKPACSTQKNVKVHGEKMSRSTSLNLLPNPIEVRRSVCHTDKYAIIVSCRCNYTESRLFFKQPTSWRPRIPRDLMISVASEISGQYSEPNERDTQLPVQVLTLQASNLTSEDLTMTVLAPASFTSPPSVGSLTSPKTTIHPFVGLSESRSIMSGESVGSRVQKSVSMPVSTNLKESSNDEVPSLSFTEESSSEVDVIPSNGYGCTHLWLQSRVPLGRVPAQSTATIKLELLPLTDGIITLDTLQIDVKDKGVTYIPERSLKINATSSISTGIF
ncbi:hypothetical protein M5689_013916 [Euphorbia peplus]|nr:hypothetical protein M5689_013916 [Euphorbia peplus]